MRTLSLSLNLTLTESTPFILQANLVQAPAAAATQAAATPAAAAAVPSGNPIELASMPIDQQLQNLQQAVEIAKLKLQLAESQYSSLESLSKQLPNAAGINAAAVPAAVPEYGLDGGARGGDVQAAYEAAAANIGTVDAASVPYGGGTLADAAGAADAAASVTFEALQATTLGSDVGAAVAQTAQITQAALSSDAVAQADQAARAAQAAAEVAGFDFTPIILVAAFLPFAFVQFNELMSVPRVTGDSANSGGGPLPSWASLAAYADSKNSNRAGEGRSAPQIVFHALVNLEKEGLDTKGWLYGGQKDWQKGYVFRQAAAPSALYSNLPAMGTAPSSSSVEAPATAEAGAATGVLAPPDMPSWVSESTAEVVAMEMAEAAGAKVSKAEAKAAMSGAAAAGKKGKKEGKKVCACACAYPYACTCLHACR